MLKRFAVLSSLAMLPFSVPAVALAQNAVSPPVGYSQSAPPVRKPLNQVRAERYQSPRAQVIQGGQRVRVTPVRQASQAPAPLPSAPAYSAYAPAAAPAPVPVIAPLNQPPVVMRGQAVPQLPASAPAPQRLPARTMTVPPASVPPVAKVPVTETLKAGASKPAPYIRNNWKPAPRQPEYWDTAKLAVTAGYRQDNLDWNIASDLAGVATPNIISELTWKDLKSYEVRIDGSVVVPEGRLRGLYFGASMHRGSIVAGDNQDSDWFGDNRTDEFSRSNNKSDEGDVQGLKVALGYQFKFSKGRGSKNYFSLTPMLGYMEHEVSLTMSDGYQTLSTVGHPLGPFGGLASTYEAEWSGAFLGLEAEAGMGRHRLNLRGEYRYLDYYAEADWNLREDFAHPVSFDHRVDESQGFELAAEYGYRFWPQWELFVRANAQAWKGEDGTTQFYTNENTYGIQKLNEVNWDSGAVHVGVMAHW